MDLNRLVQEIDAEISKLQQARNLLTGGATRRGPGRPRAGSTSRASAPAKNGRRKRRLSPEGRRRIAEAMRKRWAERRKQQGSK